MKILAVADEESRKIWDFYEPDMLKEYDLILAAGDLSPHYLSFLTTMSARDVVYVHGNHDDKYDRIPPEGCISAEDRIVVIKGLRILGLGGSMRYRNGKYMYTEKEMRRRVRRLFFTILRHRGFDVLLTHAPVYGFHDGEDLPHQGFRVFRELIEKYKPRYMIHGHQHRSYGRGYTRRDVLSETVVINACGTYELEIPDL